MKNTCGIMPNKRSQQRIVLLGGADRDVQGVVHRPHVLGRGNRPFSARLTSAACSAVA